MTNHSLSAGIDAVDFAARPEILPRRLKMTPGNYFYAVRESVILYATVFTRLVKIGVVF